MSSNLMRMALMMAATAAYTQESIFGSPSHRLDLIHPKSSIPSDNTPLNLPFFILKSPGNTAPILATGT